MDFIQFLEKEYSKRSASNANYSLRAFARDLSVDQSSLSKALARRRNLSDEVISRMAANLNLSAAQTRKFLSKSSSVIQPAYVDLEYDRFIAVSDWYHDAILELIDTSDFRADYKWIASRLEIKESQVRAAVSRLQKLNLLEISQNGEWIDTSKVNSVHPDHLSPVALKTYQKQVLLKSAKAIDQVDLSNRSHTSNTFSASSENIEEAKRLIAKCRKDVAAILRASSSKKTEVYQIQISLFPLTRNKGPKS